MKKQDVERLCGRRLDCGAPDRTFSPLFSNVGLDDRLNLYAHYNRRTALLFEPLLGVAGTDCFADRIVFQTERGQGMLAFSDTDTVIVDFSGDMLSLAGQTGSSVTDLWRETRDGCLILKGYFALTDGRDRDDRCPFELGVRVLRGRFAPDGSLIADGGKITAAVAFACLENLDETVTARLDSVETADGAVHKTRRWYEKCLTDYERPDAPGHETVIDDALITLLFNTAQAPGFLKNHVSAYPNRGTYPTHYLWDTCFQNLAWRLMNRELARGFLRQLTDNIEPDGKIPQFLCATWHRPAHSQPPLIGWAADWLAQAEDEEKASAFEAALIEPLERNTRWWLENRMTRFGLIYTHDGLECGWDDSPRYDGGAILALDMNSYLLRQMKWLAKAYARQGQADAAARWTAKADEYGQRMIRLMWDDGKGYFCDVLCETGEKRPMLTPAAFLPLWAGAPVGEERAKRTVVSVLLDESRMAGPVPFPCVSYDDPAYDAALWWRGPMWPPIAWLMIETLDKFGFMPEAAALRERVLNIILADGGLSELFNSRTGEGEGSAQQGWTAAVMLALLAAKTAR